MELRTVEVRWFIGGPCPPAVRDWFHAGPHVSEPEERTDEYLAIPGRDDIGLKQRGGTMLDFKLRTGTREGVFFPDGFAGQIEAWTKWSFPLGRVPEAFDGTWIRVDKVRWSRRYEITADVEARAVPPDSLPADGCAAELVAVRVGTHQSWGFGFEAIAELLDLGTVLEAAVHRFSHDTPLDGLVFGIADSHGYPSWLQVWPRGE